MNVDKAQEELLLGQKAKSAYDQFIEPFLKAKREDLFNAFQNVPIMQKDDLVEIKRMLMTLDALEIDVKNIIDTGIMATEQLKTGDHLDG